MTRLRYLVADRAGSGDVRRPSRVNVRTAGLRLGRAGYRNAKRLGMEMRGGQEALPEEAKQKHRRQGRGPPRGLLPSAVAEARDIAAPADGRRSHGARPNPRRPRSSHPRRRLMTRLKHWYDMGWARSCVGYDVMMYYSPAQRP